MAFKDRFTAGLIAWLTLILAASFAFVWAVQTPGLGAVRIVTALACILASGGLWRHVQRTNLQLTRFVESLQFGDLSQNFSAGVTGSGFTEVGEALNGAIRRLREQRQQLSDDNRFFEAVLDDAPTALLIIDQDGRVDLGNKAARRLFMKHSGVRVHEFAVYGDALVRSLEAATVGRPRLVPLFFDAIPQTALLSAAVVHRLGGLVRVIAVQPIQSELNAIEIAAQSDLIRVLTHEIMNSMTPVTSLAHTAAALVAKVDDGQSAAIRDAREAVETLAKRADGIMHFVQSYRQISRAPPIRARTFALAPWAHEVAAMFRASEVAEGVQFDLSLAADDLVIDADPDLLFQVLINLLRNAAEAARGHAERPRVRLSFSVLDGRRILVEVSDNGPGIPEKLRQDIFLPFFTTKEKGTGIGLSLARQIVLAHQGSIALDESDEGGATFRLLL
jgi:nitrogen fixation/metabolism regulation signal transduction histidine kinase